MNAIIQNIIKTSPVSIDDNYKTRLKERFEVLINRRDKLSVCANRGSIEYENGMAARFYPNIHYRKDFKRLGRMIAEINKELNQITRIIY